MHATTSSTATQQPTQAPTNFPVHYPVPNAISKMNGQNTWFTAPNNLHKWRTHYQNWDSISRRLLHTCCLLTGGWIWYSWILLIRATDLTLIYFVLRWRMRTVMRNATTLHKLEELGLKHRSPIIGWNWEMILWILRNEMILIVWLMGSSLIISVWMYLCWTLVGRSSRGLLINFLLKDNLVKISCTILQCIIRDFNLWRSIRKLVSKKLLNFNL